ncbi:complex I NDUFA9 subunit family protein [Labrys sp. LIt4]|uniref:complex I NDUFA9 subunit family protein n=1 Tax=Labrys sp. LIt4 TaxID=2821355 RepID=UPI001FD86C99|nr:complex I NDUFA9 subunit family protein [Labrys sp. LIt4]
MIARTNILAATRFGAMMGASISSSDSRPPQGIVAVFGGSGFLGRRIVKHLLSSGVAVRSASRHSQRAGDGEKGQAHASSFTHVEADMRDEAQVARAVAGARAVINAVSLYSEHGDTTFERVHVVAASQLAKAARQAGAERYILISGIGSDSRSRSKYIRARGQGEEAVGAAFPGATFVRPAVMIGKDDALLSTIARLARTLPAYPLFGHGETRLQPAFVEDVAQAVARLTIGEARIEAGSFEFAGPGVYTYRNLVLEVARLLGVQIRLVPIPFPAWYALAALCEFVPGAPLTRSQVELMQIDNVADAGRPGFEDLGIEPRSLDQVVRAILEKS